MFKKENLLALTGVFMPHNDTITHLSYKNLMYLDYNIDVVAFKSNIDESLNKKLKKLRLNNKFNLNYVNAYWEDTRLSRKNINILKIILNIRKYYKQAIKNSKEKEYSVLYSSSVPNFTHYAAYKIKKKSKNNIKWVASFSDPIINNPYLINKRNSKLFSKERISYYIEKILFYKNKFQKLTLKYADKLIFMSEELRDFTIGDNKDLLKKSIVIPITYDNFLESENNAENEYKFSDDGKIRFMHFGNIYGLRRIDNFLTALDELKHDDPEIAKKIEIYQYGSIEKKYISLINKKELNDIFKICGRIDYDKCLSLMKKRADVLILFDTIIDDGIQPFFPSKTIEYLLTKKPIYAICSKNSALHRILSKKYICSLNNVEEIKKTIRNQICNLDFVSFNYKKYDNYTVINRELKNYLKIDKKV